MTKINEKKKEKKPQHEGKVQNPGKTMRRIISYVAVYKGRLLVTCIFLVASLFCFVASAAFLDPFIEYALVPKNLAIFAQLLILYAGIGLLDSSGVLIQNVMVFKIVQNVSERIRSELFNKMQSLPLRFFDSNTHGELMSRYTNDMETITVGLEQGTAQLISGVLTFVGTLAYMFYSNWILTLITVAVLAVLLMISQMIIKRSSASFVQQQQTIGKLNGYVEEMLEGQKVIKAFTHEKQAENEFNAFNEEYRRVSTRAQTLAGVIMPIAGNMTNVSYTLTVVIGATMAINGTAGMTVGTLASFLVLCRMFTRPIQQLGNQINSIFAALAGAERVFAVIDEEPEADEGTITLHKLPSDTQDITRAEQWYWLDEKSKEQQREIPLRGDVRFHNVTFSYDGQKTILKDMSLYAKPGQKIAFVGATGAGKTTITNLINRFYDVQQGSITYDGIDVRDIKKDDLRHSLGMVLQDTHLFTGTIADNIRYGRLDATDEEVIAAAKRASAHSFIKRLPEGYQTFITGDGGNLSQGQRQLLAIARAAVADPPVLILDEATSSIDTRTERLIERGMDALMEGRTVFVIAHRLSTVRNANAIIVLENGEIIERGDHDSLIEQRGHYYKLYTGQFVLE